MWHAYKTTGKVVVLYVIIFQLVLKNEREPDNIKHYIHPYNLLLINTEIETALSFFSAFHIQL